MSTNTKQLKLNVRGSIRNLLARWSMNKTLKKMGVSVETIRNLNANQVEILVTGEKNNLWQVVNWSKKNDIFVFLNEVVFEFVDV